MILETSAQSCLRPIRVGREVVSGIVHFTLKLQVRQFESLNVGHDLQRLIRYDKFLARQVWCIDHVSSVSPL